MNPYALIKLGANAVAKTGASALPQVGTSALNNLVGDVASKAVANSVAQGLTGAGVSTLAKGAGSTLDGLLGRSSGIILPNAEKPAAVDLAKEFEKSVLAKTAEQELADRAERNSKLLFNMDDDNELSWEIANDIKKGEPSYYKEDPLYEQLHDIATKQDIKPDDIYDKDNNLTDKGINYNALTPQERADIAKNANESDMLFSDYETPQLESETDIDPNQMRMIDQVSAPKETKIEVTQPRTRKKNIDVVLGNKEAKIEAPVSTPGVEDVVAEPPKTSNPALADEIAELKARVSSAGGGMRGGGTTTATTAPDYGGLGDSGFNVKLKNGETTNIRLENSATGSTKHQRAARKLDDMTAKSMNANAKQYRGLVGKSGSIDGHYKTVAERIRAEKIDQANVADKAQAALSLREDIKQEGLKYAEKSGVTMDLSNIDNTIGLSAAQRRKLAELGLGLDDMLGGSGAVTPTQAEEIYKTLRDYAYNWSDSKDAITKMAGNACEKEAEAVRKIIDNTMDSINVDYKTALIEGAANNGEDPTYLRKLAGKTDFKFSDLRKDQSDWIAMADLAGNKIKDEPTLNVFGMDTGAPNPFTAGAEKIKEKIYERQAYGGGAGNGGSGGGTTPPIDEAGAENHINFTTAENKPSALGGLLGKAKNIGLVGAGLLGGMALGGGSDSAGPTDYSALEPSAKPETEQDPYSTLTIGGYNYQQLEDGYAMAMQAGDTKAAQMIGNMLNLLTDKIKRVEKSNKANSSGTASKQKAALNVLSSLMKNYKAQGPIGGNITSILNTLTGGAYSPTTAAYDSGSRGALGTVIKALGDTGALSEGDQKRALELLPRTTDSEAAAKMKYQQLVQILRGAGAQ